MFGTIPEPSGSRVRTLRTAGSPSQSKATTMAKLLQSGSSLREAIALDPGYCLQNLTKMKTFISACALLQQSSPKAQWPSNLQYQGESSVTRVLVEWCNLNLGCTRPLHQRQLYLHGPTSMRKTTFLSIVKFFNSSYPIPTGEDFYDLYQDPEPTLCYIDEYEGKGTKSLWWLKEFSQGTVMNLRQKGGQRLKMSNPALIILSNYSLEQVYKKSLSLYPSCLDPIYKRFQVVEATEPIDNLGLIEALVQALLATTAPPSAALIQELRSLISNPLGSQLSSAQTIVQCNAPSQDTAPLEENVSSAIVQDLSADASGIPRQESSNSQVMSNPPETQTVSVEERRLNEHVMERWRQERRAKIISENKVSSIDRIRYKGKTILFDGEDDALLD